LSTGHPVSESLSTVLAGTGDGRHQTRFPGRSTVNDPLSLLQTWSAANYQATGDVGFQVVDEVLLGLFDGDLQLHIEHARAILETAPLTLAPRSTEHRVWFRPIDAPPSTSTGSGTATK